MRSQDCKARAPYRTGEAPGMTGGVDEAPSVGMGSCNGGAGAILHIARRSANQEGERPETGGSGLADMVDWT